MLRNIRIENFRSLEKASVNRLTRLNLISGRNGFGKSTLLEAIFLSAGVGNPLLLFSLNNFRGDNFLHPDVDRVFRSCFHDMNLSKVIQINADEIRKGKAHQRTVRLEPITSEQVILGQSRPKQLVTGMRGHFRGHAGETTGSVKWKPTAIAALRQPQAFSSAAIPPQELMDIVNPSQDDLIYGQYISNYQRDLLKQTHNQLQNAVKTRTVDRIVASVSIVDPAVKNLIPLSEVGQETVYVDKGGRELHPINVMGSGFNHVLNISLAINEIQKGIILVDELETGLYHSIYEQVAGLIIDGLKAERLRQFFVATHSGELIEAFGRAAQKAKFTDLCLINLSDTKERVTFFEPDEFRQAVEMHAEMR